MRFWMPMAGARLGPGPIMGFVQMLFWMPMAGARLGIGPIMGFVQMLLWMPMAGAHLNSYEKKMNKKGFCLGQFGPLSWAA